MSQRRALPSIDYPTAENTVLIPYAPTVADLTHVALAFMGSQVFNELNPTSWPLFTTVEEARAKFAPGTAIMVAIGGWGDVEGFEVAAKTQSGRELFAKNVRRMVDETGADGKVISLDISTKVFSSYRRGKAGHRGSRSAALVPLSGSGTR